MVIPWGWCLFGDQPNLMAFLQTIFTIVGVLLAILAILFVMRRPIALEDALHRLGIDRGWARIILGLSGLIIVATFLFWPLGWVGKCGPTPVPVPTSTPTSASTLTLTPTPITATPTSIATVVHLTDARVHFTVVLSDDVEREIHVGDTLTLRSSDAALITVNVTVNQSPFPRLLAYNYFAPRGNIPEEHAGPNASYVAPEQPGSDIITVQITDLVTGDTILRSIKVVVDKKSP